MVKNKFWENKKVLITGYEGFLGSNLTKILLDYGARISGLDILTNRKHTILASSDLKKIKIIRGSVSNHRLVKDVISRNEIEIIFHLAAQAIVGKSFKNPLETFSANIKGTWNILESSRGNNKIKAIIIASSDKAYGIQNSLPYKECSPLAGCHPYDVSKSCADLLAYTYFYTYNLPVVVTRCGNIYGPGDFNFSRIVPGTIKSAFRDKPLTIRSDGKFTRDYIYVKDVVEGYIILAQKMHKLKLFGEGFNFSNGQPKSVLDLVKTIYELAGKKPDYKILNQARYEIRDQYLSAKKAGKMLGWKPHYTLKRGLKETITWYKEFFSKS